MEWTLAHPLYDVDDIIALARNNFESEAEGILVTDPMVFRHHVTVTTTNQLFDKVKEFFAVCRDKDTLLAYCWFDRGGYTTYSREEISNAKFHHVDLNLSLRLRVRLINDLIDQHILWAANCGIPVVCSTSIRADHEGFMRIHKKRGFTVVGSYAWIRTEEGLKCLK
jgi:hypothetical protein